MNEIITIPLPFGMSWVITGWKLIGYTGALLFTSRWIVQLAASAVSKKPELPSAFWYLSMAGSLLVLTYFIFGKNDSVGILTNIFPFFIASYNLYLDITHKRKKNKVESTP